jgi:hypothetical protein
MLRTALAVLVLFCLLAAPARAQCGPVIVIPGRPGVAVIINGIDASYAVAEGDWGLYRSGQLAPTVMYGPEVIPGPPAYGYYPYTGRFSRSGRDEIWPPANRKLPPPAPSLHRSWSTHSGRTAPVTEYPPFNPPAVINAPEFDAGKGHKDKSHKGRNHKGKSHKRRSSRHKK